MLNGLVLLAVVGFWSTLGGPGGMGGAVDGLADGLDPWAPSEEIHDSGMPRTPASPESLASLRASVRGVDFLWVLRTAILDSTSVDSVVERARRMGVRGLLVQVVGRGDAFYRSDRLPRSEALDRAPPDFDPLGRVVERAHAAGLEVHAWINCLLVWSAPRPPRDPRHVLRVHPEWVTGLRGGRPMTRLSARARSRLGVEGTYLSAAHPGVRAWLGSIAAEVAARYPVDGIHLDYIREPDLDVGYDQTTRATFALRSGVDPLRFYRLPRAQRAAADSAWRAFRRDEITEVVRAMRDSVIAVRPGLPLSAAVVADTARADRDVAQPWRLWVRQGLVDRVFPMCYAPEVQKVLEQLVAIHDGLSAGPRVVPGIAVYNTPPARAAQKIMGARALGYPLLALYSYDSLFADGSRWTELERSLEPAPPEAGR